MNLWASIAAARATGRAAISEGFCPACRGRLQPSDPPWLYCPPCSLSWHVTDDDDLLLGIGKNPPLPPPRPRKPQANNGR
jgi:hypothetical protein